MKPTLCLVLWSAAAIGQSQTPAPAKLVDVRHRCITDQDEAFVSAGVRFPTVCIVTFRIDVATSPASFTALGVRVATIDGASSGCVFTWSPPPAALPAPAVEGQPPPLPWYHAVCVTDAAHRGKPVATVTLQPALAIYLSRPL